MKRILFFITVFFLLASVNAQEQEVPDVPEVPAIYNDKENEKVIKVEIVNDSSLDAAFPKGENELRINALSLIGRGDINIFYERNNNFWNSTMWKKLSNRKYMGIAKIHLNKVVTRLKRSEYSIVKLTG